MIASMVMTAMTAPIAAAGTRAPRVSAELPPSLNPNSADGSAQSGCPIILSAPPVAVAPNQPPVPNQSTVGIINALCDVTLYFVGCGFTPTSITLGCDTNGDGVSDLSIPLKNITVINGLLFQATIPALATTPGTAFPLSCCGGMTKITLSRTVSGGDNNVFGPFTQTLVCSIDLGIRAPVVISATPSDGDCALGQNLLIPGSCFVLPDGKPNVTSVFAVEVGNPNNVIQATAIQVLNANLIDAFFQFGAANAGKTFLIYASGPNGTSRNLTARPSGVPVSCPLGNEQGISVTFRCKAAGGGTGEGSNGVSTAIVSGCRVERDESGAFTLSIFGKGFQQGATLTIGGVTPKKVRLRDPNPTDGTFNLITARKKFCDSLLGAIVVTNPDGTSGAAVLCSDRCLNQ